MSLVTRKPLVSIITPVLNLVKNGRVETFDEMVRSVRNQRYPAIEHLVIDGQSDDGTLKVLSQYEKEHAIRVLSKKDSGIYDAMNRGLFNACGEYVLFLNSDDYLCSCSAIGDEVNLIETGKCDYVFANCLMQDNGFEWVFGNNIGLFWNRMPFNHQTMLCRKSVLVRFGGFDLKYRYAADYDLILKCILAGLPYAYLNRTIAVFRMTGATIANKAESQAEQGKVLRARCAGFYSFEQHPMDLRRVLSGSPPKEFEQALRTHMARNEIRNIPLNLKAAHHCERKIKVFGIFPIMKIVEEIV